ncbi:MAG: 6-phospho-beta-glucosidase [Actinomycetia bacterium]|nr:6-phospho-beta-glucosidase [Actinomycetes bacterium]
MKIAVVGGGSTYTPELIEGFADRAGTLGLDELVLYDIDGPRLQVVGGLAQRILARRGLARMLRLSTDLSDAIAGAAAVLIQLRVGGQVTRLMDETLPNQFGMIGQETTGPGGFFKALRTVPVLLDIAERVRAEAGPECWIIDFTNPVGINTRALLDAGHRALGLCNVGIGMQRWLAALLGVEPERVRLDHLGLNHLTWVRAVEVDGTDVLPELFDRPGFEDFVRARCGVPLECARTLRALPSYYLSYYYDTDQALAKQLAGSHRARRVMEIEEELLAMYRDPALDHKPELLDQRGGAYYSIAAAALATSLLTGDGAHHYVNLRDNGAVPQLPDRYVIEAPALVDRAGARAVPVRPLAPEMAGLVQAVTAYEELTIQAAISGDPEIARRALIAHPLVRQWSVVDALFPAMLVANRTMLPAFDCCVDG